jgi:hypothetical protein
MSAGIKKILRRATEEDDIEDVDKCLDRDMSHITNEMIDKMYATRLTNE